MAEDVWLEAALHFHVQPSELRKLPVPWLEELHHQVKLIRAEQAKND